MLPLTSNSREAHVPTGCVSEKLPEAFKQRMRQYLGEEYDAFCSCYLQPPWQALRLNPLKKGLTPAREQSVFAELGFTDAPAPVPWAAHGYYYGEGLRPGRHPYHEMGLYYIQEPSAMAPAALLDPQPGERILDLCAAPGGKTTQIAAAMGQAGLLIANELHPSRARVLSRNIERMGIANAIVTNMDSEAMADRFACFFHRILVDAPCSGEGMFRRHPETMEEWSPAQVTLCARRQLDILDNAARMLMPGGRMVYSTCTFAPEENEQVVASFMERHPDFRMCALPQRFWPHKLHGEGHFAAVLEHTGSPQSCGPAQKSRRGQRSREILSTQQRQSLSEFADTVLREEIAGQLLRPEALLLAGEQLYHLPEETPKLTGLHVLRAGLHLGSFRKKRFEPSHALALSLSLGDVRQAAELSPSQMKTYLAGESIPMEGGKGWTLVCLNGFSAGWGKQAGTVLKNHYPKGLRQTAL